MGHRALDRRAQMESPVARVCRTPQRMAGDRIHRSEQEETPGAPRHSGLCGASRFPALYFCACKKRLIPLGIGHAANTAAHWAGYDLDLIADGRVARNAA